MIKQDLFKKGTTKFALISSQQHPNILISVKCIIKDVIYHDINPQYYIQVIEFYDSMRFLNKYFLPKTFRIQRHTAPIKLDFRNIKLNIGSNNLNLSTKSDIIERLNMQDKERYYFKVDSLMVFKFKYQMFDIIDKINDHLIEIKLRELKGLMTRPIYNGKYNLDTINEFNGRLKKFIGDLISKTDTSFENYILKL